jgi:hypothetical protein
MRSGAQRTSSTGISTREHHKPSQRLKTTSDAKTQTSNRSSIITLFQAKTKAAMKVASPSALP